MRACMYYFHEGDLMTGPMWARELGISRQLFRIRYMVHGNKVFSMHPPERALLPSGCSGVCWDKSIARWRLFLRVGGKRVLFGTYANLDETLKVRKDLLELSRGIYQPVRGCRR